MLDLDAFRRVFADSMGLASLDQAFDQAVMAAYREGLRDGAAGDPSIGWVDAGVSQPDDDTLVLVCFNNSAVETGFFMHERWFGVNGRRFDAGWIRAWAHLPEPPIPF